MKLSTLHEARDPKKEAELEPYLTAPFRSEKERGKEARRLAKKSHQEFGFPDRQFLAKPTQRNTGFTHDDSQHAIGDPYQYLKGYNNITVPVLDPKRIPATPNPKSNTTSLNKALSYWSRNFNGEHWPALEQAFLNRSWTFKGSRGMYDTARSSLFKYLNEIKTPWPQGEEMANAVLSSNNALWFVSHVPEIKKYAQLRPAIPGLVTQINKVFPPYKEDDLQFHVDDTFGGSQRYSDDQIHWFQRYAAGKHQEDLAAELKQKTEIDNFNQRLGEIEQQPPFAGWA